jgi:MFS family permease
VKQITSGIEAYFNLEIASQTEVEVATHFRHNFLVNAGESVAWLFGDGFHSVATIIPAFAATLTDSPIVIGLIPALIHAGWFLPQVMMAPYVERLPRRLPLVRQLGVMERLPFLGMALAVFWMSRLPENAAITIFLILIIWRGISNGLMALPWQELVATVIPISHRGRFFGYTYFVGQFLGVGGAALATWILQSQSYPLNYVLIFGIGFLATVVSWILLSLTREPASDSPATRQRPVSFNRQIAQMQQLLGEDHNFRAFLFSRGLSYIGNMAFGFVTVYGLERFHLPDAQVGVFTSIYFASSALGNILWGILGDRYGHKPVLIIAGLFWITGLVMLLYVSSAFWFSAIFVFMGLSFTGNNVADLGVAMEFGTELNRPTYIGLARTLPGFAVLFAPILGGLLVKYVGYSALIGLSLLFTVGGLLALSIFVRDPRLCAQQPLS